MRCEASQCPGPVKEASQGNCETNKLHVMEIVLFSIWFAVMCGLGIRVYLAHQSLKNKEETE